MGSILTSIVRNLEEEEQLYREKYKGRELERLGMDAHRNFQQIYRSIYGERPANFGLTSVTSIREVVTNVQKGLAERGIEWQAEESITLEYKRLEYPLSKISEFLQSLSDGKPPSINAEDARIYWESAQQHFDQFVEFVRAHDE